MVEKSIKQLLLSIAEYVVCFAIFMFVEVGIHEYCHLYVLTLLGGKGYIILTWYGAACVIESMPPQWYAPMLVSLAGGLGVFIIYTVLAVWDWLDGDFEEMASLIPFSAKNLAYGLFETAFVFVMPLHEYIKWGTVVSIAGFTVGLIASFYVLFKYSITKII